MGHKGGYLDESYFRAEEGKHLAEYRKTIPYLTVYSVSTDDQRRKQSLLDFARLQGYPEDKLKRLEDELARCKNTDEAIKEFRRLEEDTDESERASTAHNGNGKYFVVNGDEDLIKRLDDGWKLVQPLSDEKYLLQHS
jgi:hypothetical protein